MRSCGLGLAATVGIALQAWGAGLARGQVPQVQLQVAQGPQLGVAVLVLEYPRRTGPPAEAFWIQPQRAVVLYPAWNTGPVRRALGLRVRRAEVAFLFRSQEPFDVLVHPGPVRVRVVPRSGPYPALVRRWWELWRRNTRPRLLQPQNPNFPPAVEHYLRHMLSRRLELPGPARRPAPTTKLPPMEDMLGPLSGAEEFQLEMARWLWRLPTAPASAQITLPRWKPRLVSGPAGAKLPEVEHLARFVPQECLYVRCGSFANFLWLQHLLEQTGGQMRPFLAGRGIDYHIHAKLMQQLALQDDPLAKALGPLVVADVALVATDGMLVQGAGVGLLFQVRNSLLFSAQMRQAQAAWKKRFPQAQEQTLTIAGRKVRLLRTPDNRIRSFHAQVDDVHLVTNSRWLVERFFQAASGQGALSTCGSFLLARKRFPARRTDKVFVHASDAFFEHLISPQFRVEFQRRQQAAAAVQMAQLALWAARAEGLPTDSWQELIRQGLLPPAAVHLPDGSRLVHEDQQVWNDRRGAPGFFAPVPDLAPQQASPEEWQQYQQFLAWYRRRWGKLDPMTVVLNVPKQTTAAGTQVVQVEVFVAPFGRSRWWQERFGPPDRLRLKPVPGDLIAVEFVRPGGEHVFGGLRDVAPGWRPLGRRPNTLLGALWELVALAPRTWVGYLGSTAPQAALRPWIDPRQFGPPDPRGLEPGPGGLWRRRTGSYAFFSFHPQVLLQVPPLVVLERAKEPAQVRVRVGHLAQTSLAQALDSLAWVHARRITQGNQRVLEQLSLQLQVPQQEVLHAAREVLLGELVCPLGGEYRRREWRWVSSALEQPALSPQGRYYLPVLNWLEELRAFARLESEGLYVRAQLRLRLASLQLPGPEEVPPPP